MMKLQIVVLLSVALVGCATVPSAEQQRAADYGSPMDQETAERLAKDWIGKRLKDPYSMQQQCAPIEKGYVPDAPMYGIKMAFGYMLNCSINSKNSFGAYTGAKSYQFLFRNGVLVSASHQECLSGGGCYMAPLR